MEALYQSPNEETASSGRMKMVTGGGRRDAQQTATNLVKRLGKLGYEVTLKPKAA